MDNAEYRQKLHAEYKAELWKRELSNAENADKAVLTYSSAGLGFSLAFLKDFLPITKAAYAWLLYGSWILFTLAIVITISSYIIGQLGIKRQESKSYHYYIRQDEKALEEKNIFEKLTIWFNYSSCSCFVIAIVFTTIFVSTNLERATTMAEEKKVALREAAPVPSMEKIETIGAFRAAPIPSMQQTEPIQVVPTQAPIQAPQQPATSLPAEAQSSSPKGGNNE